MRLFNPQSLIPKALTGERFILWAPLWLMAGISLYFSLSNEPPAYIGITALAAALLALAISWRYPARWLVLPLVFTALGFTAGQWRIHSVATPLITHPIYYRTVEGVIDEIELVDKDTKLVIAQPEIDGVAKADVPLRLRVRFHHQNPDWEVGDKVRFKAAIFPLPEPAMPDSFDFAMYFYFRGIGGNGYSMGPLEVIDHGDPGTWMGWLNGLRHRIGNDMRTHMPGAVGDVAAAMTVGESGPIPEEVKSELRDAGLAHMLAIAGLHLGIVAGIIFFNVRLLLSLYQPWALRLPIKKIAAMCALISAFIYLSLAGFPIPAQRAFIMVSFLFTAVLLDRRGITLRTLAIAATMILLIFPESMFGASFQLSFAATLAIITLFERFGGYLHSRGDSLWGNILRHLLGIIATSLAATLATAPFVLYHFNRFAIFGLLANMVVVPLATFVIMPGMVLSLLLMPFGLQQIGYVPLYWSTDAMISMSAGVTNLPYASLHLPSPTTEGLMLAVAGLIWLCLQQKRRWLGLITIALGLSTIGLYKPYDLMVSDDGTKVAIRRVGGDVLFLRGRPKSFNGQAWLRSAGEDTGLTVKKVRGEDDAPDCDKNHCAVNIKGRHILVALRSGAENLCKPGTDMVITSDHLWDEACRDIPWAIDKAYLEKTGTVAIRFDGSAMHAETVTQYRGHRPWVPPLDSTLYELDNSSIRDDHD